MSQNNNTLQEIFASFRYLKVLVVGDAMIDKYIFGHVSRISPEAPIPVVDVYRRESRLGGAANVALNIKALGAKPLLASVVGDDDEGHEFKQLLQANGIDATNVILDQDRKTTIKTRVVSRNQQIMRYDYEQATPLEENTEMALLDNIIDIIYNDPPNVVILQDYNKGVLTPKIISHIIGNCRQAGISVAVDPKHDNFFAYEGCTLFKPNLREAAEALRLELNPTKIETLMEADRQIRHILDNALTIITLSDKGIFVGMESDRELIPAYTRRIVDVSGAGDTVIAIMALGLALDLDIFATAELANIAAGLVCEQVGVVAIEQEQLLQEAQALME